MVPQMVQELNQAEQTEISVLDTEWDCDDENDRAYGVVTTMESLWESKPYVELAQNKEQQDW